MYSAFCGTKEFSKTVLIKSQNNFLKSSFRHSWQECIISDVNLQGKYTTSYFAIYQVFSAMAMISGSYKIMISA